MSFCSVVLFFFFHFACGFMCTLDCVLFAFIDFILCHVFLHYVQHKSLCFKTIAIKIK